MKLRITSSACSRIMPVAGACFIPYWVEVALTLSQRERGLVTLASLRVFGSMAMIAPGLIVIGTWLVWGQG